MNKQEFIKQFPVKDFANASFWTEPNDNMAIEFIGTKANYTDYLIDCLETENEGIVPKHLMFYVNFKGLASDIIEHDRRELSYSDMLGEFDDKDGTC